jgi:hypothetical protein
MEPTHNIQKAPAGLEFARKVRHEMLHPSQLLQRGAGIRRNPDAQGLQGLSDGPHHHIVLEPLLGTGEQLLPETRVQHRVLASGGTAGQGHGAKRPRVSGKKRFPGVAPINEAPMPPKAKTQAAGLSARSRRNT